MRPPPVLMRPHGDRATKRPANRREAGGAPAIGIEARKGRDPAPPGLGAEHESPGPTGHRPPEPEPKKPSTGHSPSSAWESIRTATLKTATTRRAVNDATDRTERDDASRHAAGGTTGLAQGRTSGLKSRREAVTDTRFGTCRASQLRAGRFSSSHLTASPWVGSRSRSTKVRWIAAAW